MIKRLFSLLIIVVLTGEVLAAEIPLSKLADLCTVEVASETIVHLPSTAKRLIIENHQYSTEVFEQEVRAYTVQQAVFWTAATIALGTAIDGWKHKK